MTADDLCDGILGMVARIRNQPPDELHELTYDNEFAAEVDKCERLWETALLRTLRFPFKRDRKGHNRLYERLCKDWTPNELGPEAEAVIWYWAIEPDTFFAPTPIVDPDHATPCMLDSVCRLLNHLATQTKVDVVRWRLLLCFLVEFVDERITGTSNADHIVHLLIQAKLISPGVQHMLSVNLVKWPKAGRRYVSLANGLGGWGALVYLPAFAPSHYEEHYHPDGMDQSRIIQCLQEQVPTTASLKRNDWNAYEVANALRQHWRRKCPTSFFHCDPCGHQGSARPRRVRRPRKRRQTPRNGVYPPPRTPLPAMGEEVSTWQAPSPMGQSPWGSGDPMPDRASPQLSFLAPSDDDCRVFPTSSSTPLVI
ncbi:uncharacterized protein N7511_011342 [Penicillium nucicola]|uniref:uncharacterized protein n=1 Tax=Penicillium nucicola TaxID=1850975 RepID=UPI0025452E7D|nr:uncharacterized protein N7511_011342 [Penicillium nucicola]KAJ5742610.1 hypothetical protein N7511_011342 [Penicillium nucicola]